MCIESEILKLYDKHPILRALDDRRRQVEAVKCFDFPPHKDFSDKKQGRINFELREINRLKNEVRSIEVFTPYEMALKFFIEGGRICKDVISSFYGNKRNKATTGEFSAKKKLIDNKKGMKINEIAHYLWESLPDYLTKFDTTDFREAVEDVINSHNEIKTMCIELLDRGKEFLNRYIDPDYIPSSEEVEAITPYEDFQLDENFELAPF